MPCLPPHHTVNPPRADSIPVLLWRQRIEKIDDELAAIAAEAANTRHLSQLYLALSRLTGQPPQFAAMDHGPLSPRPQELRVERQALVERLRSVGERV